MIRPFSFAQYKTAELKADIDARADLLTNAHFNSVLEVTTLNGPLSLCTTSEPPSEPLSHLDAMQPQELTTALRTFAAWLSSPDVVHPARLAPLTDRRLAETVHREALRAVVGAYERICVEVRNPKNRYEAANTLLGGQRPFGSLPALRQILGIEEPDDEPK